MNTSFPATCWSPPAESDSQAPSKPAQITVWDEVGYELLHTLTCRVPLLSEAQAIHALKAQHCTPSVAAAHLEQLCVAGWLERYRCITHWPATSAEPQACWNPGEPVPELKRLRRATRRSIASEGPRSIRFYVASRFAANVFGAAYRGTVNLERVGEWLAWAQLYLHLLTTDPQLAARCDGREICAPGRAPTAMPSHLMIMTKRSPVCLIGLTAYSSLKGLLALHAHCQQRSLSYRLW